MKKFLVLSLLVSSLSVLSGCAKDNVVVNYDETMEQTYEYNTHDKVRVFGFGNEMLKEYLFSLNRNLDFSTFVMEQHPKDMVVADIVSRSVGLFAVDGSISDQQTTLIPNDKSSGLEKVIMSKDLDVREFKSTFIYDVDKVSLDNFNTDLMSKFIKNCYNEEASNVIPNVFKSILDSLNTFDFKLDDLDTELGVNLIDYTYGDTLCSISLNGLYENNKKFCSFELSLIRL